MLSCIEHYAYPKKVLAGIMEVPLTHVRLGEICLIQATEDVAGNWRQGQVLGFKPGCSIVGLFDDGRDLSTRSRVYPTGRPLGVYVGQHSLGGIYNGAGQLCARMVPELSNTETRFAAQWRRVDSMLPNPLTHQPLVEPFYTGLRTIDGLMTCCKGQRVGIFAAAGAGKSTLLSALLKRDNAEVMVIALIGERGREVKEFIEHGLTPEQRKKAVLVYSTSDSPPIERKNAANAAMAVAEYFRDAGCQVLLLMDSVTRYARALREVGFAAGEPMATSGFPASVFAELPRLLERAGPRSGGGAITGFFTVLLESQRGHDPIGEEVRSILDGHIYLSTKLAAASHYPAIDVLNSLSRLFLRVTNKKQQQVAATLRRALQRLDEVQLLLELGEYQPGYDVFTDQVIEHKAELMAFLQQQPDECEEPEITLQKMSYVASTFS